MPVRFRQLEYFVAICETGSFTAAAERLHVAQPSLSQQIKALETELDCRLLERSNRGVQPTTAGRVFLREARSTLSARDGAVTAVRKFSRSSPTELQILTLRSIASGILTRTLSPWTARHPGTVLRFRDFSHRRILEEHARLGEGDVAVGPLPESWTGSLRLLGYEEMLLVFPSTDDARHDRLDIDRLSTLDWILYEPRNGLTEVIDAFCTRYEVSTTPRARTDQADVACQMALDGWGIAIVPEHIVPPASRAHTRRAGAGLFRAVAAYTRTAPDGIAADYLRLLAEVDLSLRPEHLIPSDAIRI